MLIDLELSGILPIQDPLSTAHELIGCTQSLQQRIPRPTSSSVLSPDIVAKLANLYDDVSKHASHGPVACSLDLCIPAPDTVRSQTPK